jgi:hypothetical protein
MVQPWLPARPSCGCPPPPPLPTCRRKQQLVQKLFPTYPMPTYVAADLATTPLAEALEGTGACQLPSSFQQQLPSGFQRHLPLVAELWSCSKWPTTPLSQRPHPPHTRSRAGYRV